MIIQTLVCEHCHCGWYGGDGDNCYRCKRRAVVRGEFHAIDLDPEWSRRMLDIAMAKSPKFGSFLR